MDERAMTAGDKRHLVKGVAHLAAVEHELARMVAAGQIPEGWRETARGEIPGAGRRVRVTLAMPAGTYRFFKDMGPGHLGRMAAVLSSYAEFRLARLIEGAGPTEAVRDVPATLKRFAEDGEIAADLRGQLAQAREMVMPVVEALKVQTARADTAEAALRELGEVLGGLVEDDEED